MTPPLRLSDDNDARADGPLAQSLIALAGTADDASDIDTRLVVIARLAADTVPAVTYASVTAYRDNAYTTVAATSDLAIAVDKAQYDEQDGPCLDALDHDKLVAVPDLAMTMAWPGFRQAAFGMGLRSSLSIPLFAGRGVSIAALNLYSHDAAAMAALTDRVRAVYSADRVAATDPGTEPSDPGTGELTGGLAAAFAVRRLIQLAIGAVMVRDGCSADDGYLTLRVEAAETGTCLTDVAVTLLEHRRRSTGDAGG
ncbi:MAG: hypothetical protein QOI74_1818 [Micromonosporaceae bacterium]|nr:hypothetical protein [Micromonosporaceae bacterium]